MLSTVEKRPFQRQAGRGGFKVIASYIARFDTAGGSQSRCRIAQEAIESRTVRQSYMVHGGALRGSWAPLVGLSPNTQYWANVSGIEIYAIPEPGTVAGLFGLLLAGLFARRRKYN